MTKLERYIEVYSNDTDELLDSLFIQLPENITILYINPDDDDEFACCSYVLNEAQVLNLGGRNLIEKYKTSNVEYQVACYQILS
ncbi:DUF7683 domain-containing protein [Histophilus somni]|uniref:DUF7683 domain-containing protein n=1 Tax=Histophilus somni TaxID=731 RepID=A0AAX2S0C6_HISSO|nr:hypothetical protein [Histophilus somni]ACA31413.1 hypothetical protein HSM_1645 [Histophilus somni 2336]TDF35910.1 hypothetical protein E1290_09450 [Histophilus somni]TEW26467.1 hypothetical protein E2R48_10315 [Histophilus somni]TFF00550.1 hypothetical protein E3U35_10805 [Histophilus somni]THA20714.1 hypothetical protein E5361_09725 [Histophilus somni]